MLKPLQNLFKLPSPKDLGWSASNALGSRKLTPFQEGKTWEDWDDYVRKNHPIKFFFVETLPDFFRPIWWKADRIWYWLKCHTLPSYRWHKLDMRGIDPLSNYTHGYMDPCEVMRLAAWKALRNYIEKELSPEPYEDDGQNELGEDWHKEQKLKRYTEPMALYRYWMEERVAEEAEEKRLFELMRVDKAVSLAAADREAYEAASKAWYEFHRAREVREQEMFMRLCAIREYLWT